MNMSTFVFSTSLCFPPFRSKKNFEVVQAYLHRFLKHYSDLIMTAPDLREASKALRDEQEESSRRIKQLVQHSLCLVGYLSNLQS